MTKKLLHKTSAAYLLFSLVVLGVSAPLFYYTIERLYMQDTDETLILHKNEFLHYSLPALTVADIADWNKYNRNVKIEPFNNISKDTLFYTAYYDTLDAENEPYRELNTPVTIEQQRYTYKARISLVETEDLIKSIALLFVAVMVVLLAGLFLITRQLSVTLWKPFYKTLQEIEAFEIDKSRQPHFSETGIEEFNRLNQSIGKLIERNMAIYKSQREFIENAAHELQTPLAVFQAKIDTLMQRSDVTKEQSEILSSLNDNVFRLNRLNKNLLLLSKIDNESYSNTQSISLNELIEKHSDFFAEQAKAKNIAIELNLAEPLEVKSNPVLAEVLINNLFLNAIRHNVTNGKITVKLSNRLLTISNTGETKSLPADTLFNRFSKVNPSEQGTGLGLSIVKKIADINNWTVAYSYSKNLHSFSISF
jgi:two-component system sensor histidine kinase ArlS